MIPAVETTWAGRYDILRQKGDQDFNDLGNIVACHFEMYSRLHTFLAPWNARQIGSTFPYHRPDRDKFRTAIGSARNCISDQTVNSMIEAADAMCIKTKGHRQLITPNIVTHHSAQFNYSAFTIEQEHDIISTTLHGSRGAKPVHRLTLYGAKSPVYIEDFRMRLDTIGFVIVRPKMGKSGMPNLSAWEALFFTQRHQYLLDHTDSNLNPRWSGVL